jgi:hypothetical protein
VLGAAGQRFFVNFECDFAEELVTLVQRASRADDIDKGMLCGTAIRVIQTHPETRILPPSPAISAKPYLIGLRVYGVRMLFEAICVQYLTAINIPTGLPESLTG